MNELLSLVGRLYVTSNQISVQLEETARELENLKQESKMKDQAIRALREQLNIEADKSVEKDQSKQELSAWNIGPVNTQ